MSVRWAVVKKPQLLKRLEVRLVKAVWRQQRAKARRLGWEGRLHGAACASGSGSRSSLQLTPHLHVLLPVVQWHLGIAAGRLGRLGQTAQMKVAWKLFLTFAPNDDPDLPAIRALADQ